MEHTSLKSRIIEAFKHEEHKHLEEMLLSALNQHRERTIENLEAMIFDVEGRLRMKILEVLGDDGGADLIPIFIDAIRREKNILYAKSQILLFKSFRHQRALGALLSIENDIEAELKPTFQRTLGRLLSQFSEQFYMSEFQAGIGDRRRVAFAADMMLRSPHPDFVPFLNERILESDMGYRSEGLRVLREQGERSSNEAIFAMLGRLRRQDQALNALQCVMEEASHEPRAFFDSLVDGSNLDWNEALRTNYFQAISSGEVEDALGQILDAYHINGEVRRKLKPYIKGILAGAAPSPFQSSRATSALAEYAEELKTLQHDSAETMGLIADREDDPLFLRRLEANLPFEDANRDALIISGLAGYRKPESVELLVEYANTCSEPEMLERTIVALSHYDRLEDVPSGIEKLCFDEHNGMLRRKALDLMARWGYGEEISARLLESPSLSVCADGVAVIAEYRLKNGYPLLLDILRRPSLPDSLAKAVLEALQAFPAGNTGRAAKPFLNLPHTFTVRKAALEALFYAGGDERFDIITKTLAAAAPGRMIDSIEAFLELLMKDDFPGRDAFLLKEREMWVSVLLREEEAHWPLVLQMIENLPIEDNFQARSWLIGMKKVIDNFTGLVRSAEERRVVAIVERLEEKVRIFGEQERHTKVLQSMIDSLLNRNRFQRTQAMRNLALNFPIEMILKNEAAVQKIVGIMLREFEDPNVTKDMLMQLVALSSKIRHPKLFRKIEPLLEYSHIDVRNAAKDLLDLKVHEAFSKPVRSAFIMDDSRYITKQLAKVLTKHGIDSDFENHPDQGLEIMKNRRFDLLILDLIMPRMNGAEFLKEVRRSALVPEFTLVVTSSRSQEELKPLMDLGIDGLLLKPFRMEELIQRIRELVPGS